MDADFDGYTCLEAHSKIERDRVEALIKQRELWTDMVMEARKATA